MEPKNYNIGQGWQLENGDISFTINEDKLKEILGGTAPNEFGEINFKAKKRKEPTKSKSTHFIKHVEKKLK